VLSSLQALIKQEAAESDAYGGAGSNRQQKDSIRQQGSSLIFMEHYKDMLCKSNRATIL